MGWTFTFLVCLVVAVHGFPQENLEDLIGSVFNTDTRSQQPPAPARPSSNSNRDPGLTQDEGIGASCTQEDGTVGECVQYYLCNANNSIITDGVGLLDIRINEESPCVSYLDVCCGSGEIRETPILPPTTPRPNTSGPSTGRPGTGGSGTGQGGSGTNQGGSGTGGSGTGGSGTGGSGTGGSGTGGSGIGQGGSGTGGSGTGQGGSGTGSIGSGSGLRGCGQRNPDGVGFRIKGNTDNEAAFGEFPWMVAILREEPVAASGQKLNVYICGGSLIHPKVVMTSAHCVAPKDGDAPKLKIRAGEWDTQTKQEIFPHQDRNVVKIVSHEQYYAGALYNDIALLILDSPVQDAENVGIVCLPPVNEEPPTSRCYASGWGKDVFGKEGKYQVILKRVGLPIVPRKQCQADLRKTRLGNKFMLHRTFICAGGEKGKDTCRGDGGSPLVCPMPGYPNKYMQSGIVAWGIGCGEGNTPGVYAHVSSLRSWVDDQLYLNNINDMNLYKP